MPEGLREKGFANPAILQLSARNPITDVIEVAELRLSPDQFVDFLGYSSWCLQTANCPVPARVILALNSRLFRSTLAFLAGLWGRDLVGWVPMDCSGPRYAWCVL
jgi:hypothetical protein